MAVPSSELLPRRPLSISIANHGEFQRMAIPFLVRIIPHKSDYSRPIEEQEWKEM